LVEYGFGSRWSGHAEFALLFRGGTSNRGSFASLKMTVEG
jgi:hypothetical protein